MVYSVALTRDLVATEAEERVVTPLRMEEDRETLLAQIKAPMKPPVRYFFVSFLVLGKDQELVYSEEVLCAPIDKEFHPGNREAWKTLSLWIAGDLRKRNSRLLTSPLSVQTVRELSREEWCAHTT